MVLSAGVLLTPKHYCVFIATLLLSGTTTSATEECDLNDDACFMQSDTRDWKFNYVHTKQQYLDLISQGKSGLVNPYREMPGLPRRSGYQVGNVDHVTLKDGRTVQVITKALKPMLFEIPDFLTDSECDHIIQQARERSQMPKSDPSGWDKKKEAPAGQKGRSYGTYGKFTGWDRNLDDKITVAEIIEFIHSDRHIILSEKEVLEMFEILKMADFLRDDVIDENEFRRLDMLGVESYVRILGEEHPMFMSTYLEHDWLDMPEDDVTEKRIRERLVDITGLGRETVYGGGRPKVLHYGKFGHYHAHFDSESHSLKELPCCQLKYTAESWTKCRLCRYVSVTMFLNDVEEGGEVAFPIADGEPLRGKKCLTKHLRGNSSASDKLNLSHGCKLSNLVISARKGTAILWYNHLVDEDNGWMGELDQHSINGDCDVITGEKWKLNMWIPAPYYAERGLASQYMLWSDLHQAQYHPTK